MIIFSAQGIILSVQQPTVTFDYLLQVESTNRWNQRTSGVKSVPATIASGPKGRVVHNFDLTLSNITFLLKLSFENLLMIWKFCVLASNFAMIRLSIT